MSVTVINAGPIQFTATGQKDTKKVGYQAEIGTVRVSYENREYVFGPNDSKTLENGIAAALVAQDNRLRIMDTRDGVAQGGGIARS